MAPAYGRRGDGEIVETRRLWRSVQVVGARRPGRPRRSLEQAPCAWSSGIFRVYAKRASARVPSSRAGC